MKKLKAALVAGTRPLGLKGPFVLFVVEDCGNLDNFEQPRLGFLHVCAGGSLPPVQVIVKSVLLVGRDGQQMLTNSASDEYTTAVRSTSSCEKIAP